MQIRKLKGAQVLLAAMVAAMVVLPIALASANGSTARKGVSPAKQIKALTKRLNALETSLSDRVSALEAKKGPTTLPPSGPAGGSLAGSYPNPLIRAGAVGSPEIADGSIGAGDLGPLSVGGASLKGAFPVVSAGTEVKAGELKVEKVSCPAGTRLIAGGAEWGSNANGASLISSGPTFEQGDPNVTWTVQGRVDTGGGTNRIFAEALCLTA